MKKLLKLTIATLAAISAATTHAKAEEYIIDTEGAHAFIQFRIKHLGYSWLYGRFNKFNGTFNIDRDALEKSSIKLDIDPASIDSNHAERDKHLRDTKFLSVNKFPKASFTSTSLKLTNKESGILTGNLFLHGVEKPIEINVKLIGEGNDPWGGYRAGFEGTTTLTLKDFGIADLGPASTQVEMFLSIEGVKKS
jgi:polyisoprenoid-binding protein YceI